MGGFKGSDVVSELFGFANLGSERQGVAGGAEANGLVGVVHSFGEDGDAAKHEALEFLPGEVGGLLAVADQFPAEVIVCKPAAQGAFADAGCAGCLGDRRGGGDDV